MNAQVKRHKKERIYEAQLANPDRVRPKMLGWFGGFKPEVADEEIEEDGDSPSPAKHDVEQSQTALIPPQVGSPVNRDLMSLEGSQMQTPRGGLRRAPYSHQQQEDKRDGQRDRQPSPLPLKDLDFAHPDDEQRGDLSDSKDIGDIKTPA